MAKNKKTSRNQTVRVSKEPLRVRPYQLLEVLCALGGDVSAQRNPAVKRLRELAAKKPDAPLMLVCNAAEIFEYQYPGTKSNTPDGDEVNLRRDLEILHKINFFPGAIVPALIVFNRVWDFVTDLNGICCFRKHPGNPWPSWSSAKVKAYRRGLKKTSEFLFKMPQKADLKRKKNESIVAMTQAKAVDVRPHILLCSVCQYGAGVRPPFAEDNLPELIQHIRQHPETKLRMAPHADWMMCAPCPYRMPENNACVNNRGSGGLPNQMRDLRVLEKLGLKFGDILPGLEVYRRMFERIHGTLEICRIEQGRPSFWWTGCGAAVKDSKAFAKGRRQLLKLFFNKTVGRAR